jgi:putative ABC transport system permease protein
MLQLKGISKVYSVVDQTFTALNNINLSFNSGEFVSILGPSGGGKTTLLNIIGGLDRYTAGDLLINGKSTIYFKATDWDAYRNNSVGFIFQNYNLIPHISILENVTISMTLSGISTDEKRKKAIELLNRVGLKDQIDKKPNALSGGQKQRVAIARALSNDPDIILADEPTGALDTESSKHVMELIKEISNDKLVIMVTHNPDLAETYSTRIIELKDGEVVGDSNRNMYKTAQSSYQLKHTQMSFLTALILSFQNLKTKLARTLITAFAGSIGIIGVALVLSVSSGFNDNVRILETEALYSLPISIARQTSSINLGLNTQGNINKGSKKEGYFNIYDSNTNTTHTNTITNEYLDYVNQLNPSLYSTIEYRYGIRDTLLYRTSLGAKRINTISLSWYQLNYDSDFLNEQFDLVAGRLPSESSDLLVIVDQDNRINIRTLQTLEIYQRQDVEFETILNKELVFPYNDVLYERNNELFIENTDLPNLYEHGKTLRIVGVLKVKDESTININYGVYYQQRLKEDIITENMESEVCIAQQSVNYNVLTGETFGTEATRTILLQSLGCELKPTSVNIYPASYEAKERIKTYLDQYNEGLPEQSKILYNDFASNLGEALGTIIHMISTILVAFSAISLIVSSIMIGIITYVSVIERTKEIGILRALGARKKDISRVFNAEAIIIGVLAGVMGVVLTYLLSFPLNNIFNRLNNEFTDIVQVEFIHGIILILISILLTYIAGLIPARIASRKDPVDALRHNE